MAWRSSPIMRAARSWAAVDRKSTRLNSSHGYISYAVFFLKKKNLQTASFFAVDKQHHHRNRPDIVDSDELLTVGRDYGRLRRERLSPHASHHLVVHRSRR